MIGLLKKKSSSRYLNSSEIYLVIKIIFVRRYNGAPISY